MLEKVQAQFDKVNRLLNRGYDLMAACKKIGMSKEEYLQVNHRDNTPEENKMIEEFLQKRRAATI